VLVSCQRVVCNASASDNALPLVQLPVCKYELRAVPSAVFQRRLVIDRMHQVAAAQRVTRHISHVTGHMTHTCDSRDEGGGGASFNFIN
jgi:hypothetical protein